MHTTTAAATDGILFTNSSRGRRAGRRAERQHGILTPAEYYGSGGAPSIAPLDYTVRWNVLGPRQSASLPES